MKNLKSISVAILMLISLLATGQETSNATETKKSNLANALSGKIPGVSVTTSTPVAGSSKIVSRCNASITGNNKPLFIVDGIPFDNNNEINGGSGSSNLGTHPTINPDDIESVTVVKGEQAIKLYGSKAHVGVILITTKKGNRLEAIKTTNRRKIKLKGTITDCENNTISNVDIFNLNTKETFKSDSTGKYTIKAYEKNLLQFSKNDFESQRILIQKKKEINISLKMKPTIQGIKSKGVKTEFGNGQIILRKPVIYLYPKEKTDIDFQLNFKGELLTTFPKYDKNWTLTAYPDGKIFDKKTNRFYTSLFWDGKFDFPKEHYNYKEGFVVSKNNLNTFLIEKLEHIGLNTFETNDFMQYWLPILEKNEINFIHFRVNTDYDLISKNIVNPKPDTSIRVFMDFYALDKIMEFQEQILPKTERKGFTLIEWGGSDVSIPVKERNNL
ncbi:TonB-dependent receptor plug domain-containing protein [Flavobacterium sp.]|uniref:TonB-dependent receptor plug domain-containing protein n=1 Tax=Flavobacterium sp. TaxID=239 RepID=UPI00286DF81A|nr:TonB-dependent receptor plug domain-containing protein [Flavobacterium sp.]